MKCADCKVYSCLQRSTDGVKECVYETHPLQVSTFDWQSFRAEAAKDILCAMIHSGYYGEDRVLHQSELAVKYATELVKQLKIDEK